ncbi:MAG: ribokinase [Alphaproteobacteria bacterium]|nr:ribokinase [Alphaproteobacteria bacterium]
MIVVFGSLNIDMVMRVEKMPRPGDTVLCPSYRMVAGGKGANQAVAASKAGASVKLFGKVGDDEFGRIVLTALKESSIDLTGVSVSKESSTGCATICVNAQGENMITVASGANLNVREKEIPDFLLAKENVLLLQMETPIEENWNIIRRAKKFGARIILNLAPAHDIPQDILESLDILVLNQIEATLLALHLGFDVISPTVAARRIAANYGITCVVTLGKLGAIACSSEGTWEVKAMDIDAVDTTAAGDAFVGVLAASLDRGEEMPVALRRASVASGLACLNAGAQASLPTIPQIEAHLKKVPLPRQIA